MYLHFVVKCYNSQGLIVNMSGHSKWSTIKHQKGINDQKKGKVFSRLSKLITLAAKEGGSVNPEYNAKLRIAIEAARAENMPKINIDRALAKMSEGGDLYEIVYEGFGPAGVQILVYCATDNRNRSAQ